MRARLLAEAEAELLGAAQAYANLRMELANRFLDAVHDAQLDVEKHPQRFPPPVNVRTSRQIRRRLITGFPYLLIYEVRDHELVILAVAHTSRKPGYWTTRTE